MLPPTPVPDDFLPDCGRVRGELAGLVYGELPPDARAALERHLASCAACREELVALRDTQKLLARWETPAVSDDPRVLARTVRDAARGERGVAVRRARLVRWSAVLSGAAAACLFILSVLNAELRVGEGSCALSFRLPGTAEAAQPALPGDLRDEVRAIAAEEFASRTARFEEDQEAFAQRCSEMTRDELLRLAQAVDSALAQNQETWNARLVRLGEEAQRADLETRRALTDLASYIPVSHTPR